MKTIATPRLGAQQGVLLVMLAAVTWGTVGVTTKALYGMSATNSLSIGFFRLALATPALFLLGWITLGNRLFWIRRQDFFWMLVMGGLTAIYQVCYFAAIAQVGVTIATLVTLCAAPILVATLATGWKKEPLPRLVLLALVCASVGTALLITVRPTLTTQAALTSGILLALSSALCYAIVTLVSKHLSVHCHPFQSIAIGFTFGALLLFVCALATGFVVNYPPLGWSLLVYLGLVPTAFAYGLFLVGIRTTTATVASTATLLEPLTATMLAWLLFGEHFQQNSMLGASLLIGAMLLLYVNSRRQ
ncbi:EamA family transporter [soil metagenome]